MVQMSGSARCLLFMQHIIYLRVIYLVLCIQFYPIQTLAQQ